MRRHRRPPPPSRLSATATESLLERSPQEQLEDEQEFRRIVGLDTGDDIKDLEDDDSIDSDDDEKEHRSHSHNRHRKKCPRVVRFVGFIVFLLWVRRIRLPSRTIEMNTISQMDNIPPLQQLSSVDQNVTRATIQQQPQQGRRRRRKRPFWTRLGASIPQALQRNLADLSKPYNSNLEVPFFWKIPFTGETIAKRVFTKCHGLRQGGDEVHVYSNNNNGNDLLLASERDTSVQDRNLRLADVFISPQLHEFVVANLDPSVARNNHYHKGRFFTLLRHPVARSLTLYFYLATASEDSRYNPQLKDMTIQEYAASPSMERNYMTRFLVNKPKGALTRSDLKAAKETLRFKCLIGLYEDLEASLLRFDRYFGWSASQRKYETDPGNVNATATCRAAVLAAGDARLLHPLVKYKSPDWNALVAVNRFDVELYEYALLLYRHQGEQIFGLVYQQ